MNSLYKKILLLTLIAIILTIYFSYNSDGYINAKFKDGFTYHIGYSGRLTAKLQYSNNELTVNIDTKDFNYKNYEIFTHLFDNNEEIITIWFYDYNETPIQKIAFRQNDIIYDRGSFKGVKTVKIKKRDMLKIEDSTIKYKSFLDNSI